MLWVWLAIIGAFILMVVLDYGTWQRAGKLADAHDANINALLKSLRELQHQLEDRFVEVEREVALIKQRLGYEELDRRLAEAVIWGEHRERALRNVFPRLADLEAGLQYLESTMSTVFEINDLKNWASLTSDERIRVTRSGKIWP
jgi:hypothetical protein